MPDILPLPKGLAEELLQHLESHEPLLCIPHYIGLQRRLANTMHASRRKQLRIFTLKKTLVLVWLLKGRRRVPPVQTSEKDMQGPPAIVLPGSSPEPVSL